MTWSPSKASLTLLRRRGILRQRWRSSISAYRVHGWSSRLHRLPLSLLLFGHALVDVTRTNERQWLVCVWRSRGRYRSYVRAWAPKAALSGRALDTSRRDRASRSVQRLRHLARVAELSHAPTSLIWASAVLAYSSSAPTGAGIAFGIMDRSAGAELPPLSVRAAVKARLALQLLWVLLSVGWLLLYSVIVIFVIAAPVVAVVVVGLGLRPFLGAVSTRNSLEGDGLVGGVLTRLRHGYGMLLCEVGGSVGQLQSHRTGRRTSGMGEELHASRLAWRSSVAVRATGVVVSIR
jgi:hypothetical protein